VSCLPPSASARTSARLQIQQIFALGGLRALHFGSPHRIDSDPSGPYGRKILVASMQSLSARYIEQKWPP
jgi:hypothetical protein